MKPISESKKNQNLLHRCHEAYFPTGAEPKSPSSLS
ncbi:hypothetical protein J2S19_002304 [Metabacillus malikii]|uniref:Uncharacterized protein n=1 Tax=Metabacillus malikii TaxID=1504265 RepID=A0ABT9ZFI3_9BACI|nr:hypothetical protein [Metabacillus malikii]